VDKDKVMYTNFVDIRFRKSTIFASKIEETALKNSKETYELHMKHINLVLE
jgi:hypothetical protein